ncbi:DUF4333 domain-containing protein [Glycomyces sp. NRRL B-16210]|uniref:DUF4333 domain-containing protein n=1 Tax=Glycomyces sp. NRRL B-16210 TaxID=1463821 RepID=UPI00068A3E36|nr:DUF4333 domain-containing protein [Glycomyces sp. NRRL B-16210]
MPIRKLAALPLAIAVIGLSACTFEAGQTVSGEKLAEAAEDALEGEIGSRPDVDCGDDSIIVSQDKEVDCLLTDPATGLEYDTTVTFTGVDGDEWSIQVDVASEANNGEAEESEAPANEGADGTELSIAGSDLAAAAADALEAQVGSRPDIDCGDLQITIYEGRQTYCTLTDAASGEEYEVTIDVTSIEGEQFNFDVQVASTPK